MTIFSADNLYRAYKQCMRKKRNTTNALKFELNREQNLFNLLQDLKSGRYKISRHICFVVRNPAPREIFASDFRDRIVQHLLYHEIGHIFEQEFFESSYANRKDKGTHRAFKKARFFLMRGGLNRQKLFYLKTDIKSFFRSIHKETLWQFISETIHKHKETEVWKREVLWIVKKIVFHDPTQDYIFKGKAWTKKLIRKEKSLFSGDTATGIPIGNITSQLFANIYLHKMDFFIQRVLGFSRYVRYVDDFIIFHENKELLEKSVVRIESFLNQQLLLRLCQDKTFIHQTEQGVDFLGYFIKPTHTLVRKKVVTRFKKSFYKQAFSKKYPYEKIKKLSDIMSAYRGHFIHAHSFRLLMKVQSSFLIISALALLPFQKDNARKE